MSNSVCKSTVLIREAEPGEWDALLELTMEAYSQYEKDADPVFWNQYQENIRNTILSAPEIVRLVAIKDGVLLASAIYCPPSEKDFGGKVVINPYPEMRLLSVSSEHRNEGLGALLIEECEDRTRKSGFAAMTLHTTHLMTVARNMYERRGYRRFEQIDFEPAKGFTVWGYIKRMSEND
ncbi:MAG TPA: GNAT family N-acetyltransferase [Drouetiella sp.]|jgi:GNAT superfamily N-acetyltransferase